MAKARVTIKDIAEAVNVSPRAVSAALNGTGRISAAMRQRIQQTAREMNYRPNMLARGLVQQRTYLVGVVIPYVSNSFFSRILHGIEERSVAEGFDILLGNSEAVSNEYEDRSLERMINRNVDGVICSPSPSAYRTYLRLKEHGVPVLQLMRAAEGLDAPYLGVDDVHGGYLATKFLIDLGHRAVGFLSHYDGEYAAIRDRRDGFFRAFLESGLSCDFSRWIEPGTLSVGDGYRAASELIDRAPEITAIFAATDYAAIGAIKACLARNLRVPADISVIGYDDIDLAANQIDYPLTTVAQPKERIGQQAFDVLLRLMAGGEPAGAGETEPASDAGNVVDDVGKDVNSAGISGADGSAGRRLERPELIVRETCAARG